MDTLESGLLGINIGKTLQQFAAPFGVKFFPGFEYVLVAPLLIIKAGQYGYSSYANYKQRKNYELIEEKEGLADNSTNGIVLSKFDKVTKILKNGFIVTGGIAAFNKATQATNNGPVTATGVPVMLIFLGFFCWVLYVHALYKNYGYKAAVKNNNNQHSEAYSYGSFFRPARSINGSTSASDRSLLLPSLENKK